MNMRNIWEEKVKAPKISWCNSESYWIFKKQPIEILGFSLWLDWIIDFSYLDIIWHYLIKEGRAFAYGTQELKSS